MKPALRGGRIGDIPVLWAEPPQAGRRGLALWLHGFGGTKEGVEAQLLDLAGRGFIALSFDAVQHGTRRTESQDALKVRVRSNLRGHFWPILAQTAEEAPAVIDWAQARFGVGLRVMIGGISMGGDIAVAAAAIDRRIERVAVTLATPDWLRPGSSEPQGAADDDAWTLYRRRNPLTNLERYRHCPAMVFHCGEADRQVPADGAVRFARALGDTYAGCPERLAVVIHEAVAHRFDDAMWRGVVDWFAAGDEGERERGAPSRA
jgi:uncharacterized protein